ncbi:hypothetical protein, partial [Novosphingobium sp.]|uniref:hypothetical protein n=1 Tax=Novosphingobium sp. TaxID=1874826 RepID=UPI003D6D92CD
MGVDPEGRGAAVAVAEAAGGGAGEHLGGGVVTEIAEGDVDTELSGQPLDTPGQRVRQDRVASVHDGREHAPVRPQRYRARRGSCLAPGTVLAQDLRGHAVERDTAALVGFGV